MSLESIKQNAHTILETQKLYLQLQQQSTPQAREKMKQLKEYMLSLTKNMQQVVEEEKQNVG